VIVCLCHNISDGTVRATIEAGARSINEVAEACHAGRDCGACRPTIGRLLTDAPRECPTPRADCPRSSLNSAGS
jgi:bacterioferritin-associated ferredoxin